jgi:hypothetical protein
VESIKRPLSKPKTSLKIKMLAYNATNNIPAVVQKVAPTKKRSRRSWGGFWGAALSLATEDQLNQALQKEVEITDNERILSSSLFNITITNAQMISSLKTLTTGVSKLVTEEQGIFDQIDTIMDSESQYLEQLNELINLVDKTTTLVADYQMIQLQISLLIHLTEKVKALVNAILTHTIDVTQIPLSIFKPHLQDNLKMTLRLANYKLKQTTGGTVLNIQMPVLSNPYIMYTFQILPFKINNLWYQSVTPPDVAINAISEIIDVQSTLKGCTKIHNDYACDPQHVRVYKFEGLLKAIRDQDDYEHNSKLLCALQTYREIASTIPTKKMPCGLQVINFLAQQMYIIKGQSLVLASPNNDTITSECKVKTDEINAKVKEGVNTIILKPGCHYETSQLIVHTVHKVEQLQNVIEFDEIDAVNTLASLDELLEEGYPPGNNMSVIRKQLQKYNDSLIENRHTVESLRKTLSTVDKIHQIAEFDPMTLDFSEPLATSNWITAIFWTLVLLVVAIIIYASYRRCPTPCTNCMVVPFIVLKHMCCVCVDVVHQATRASYEAAPQHVQEVDMIVRTRPIIKNPQSTNITLAPAIPSAPADPGTMVNYQYQEDQFLKFNVAPIQWNIVTGPYDAMSLQSAVNVSKTETKRVRYDPISRVVTDMEMNRMEYVPKPPANVLMNYEARLAKLPPIETFTDNEGVIRHKIYMHLSYMPNSNRWVNVQTGQPVTGLASPKEYSTAVRY